MATNLPNDPLEKFIKESFDALETQPGKDVWDRIAHTLDQPAMPQVRYLKKWYWTVAAAAFGILLITLICTNLSLRKQLDDFHAMLPEKDQKIESNKIPSELNNKENKVEGTITSNAVSNPKESEQVQPPLKDEKTTSLPGPSFKSSSEDRNELAVNKPKSSTNIPLQIPSIDVVNQRKVAEERVTISHGKSQKAQTPRKKYAEVVIVQNIATNDGKDINTTSHQNNAAGVSIHPSPVQVADPEVITENTSNKTQLTHTIYSLVPVMTSIQEVVSTDRMEDHLKTPGIREVWDNNSLPRSKPLSIGVYAGILSESGHIEDRRNKFPPGIEEGRSAYKTSDSWQTGISLVKSFSNQWYFHSGLGIKHYDMSNELNQNLLFGSRRPKPGNKPYEHDWDLKLNCPGGSSQIEVRSEQADTRVTLNENELIRINIRNKTELDYLSVPLTVGYRVRRGAWSFQFNGGLHTDFLIRKRFEQPIISIDNALLKVRADRQDAKFEQSNPIVFNGLLGGSLNYKLNKYVELQLSPNLYIPFNHRDRNQDVRIETHSFGIQFGIQYAMNSL